VSNIKHTEALTAANAVKLLTHRVLVYAPTVGAPRGWLSHSYHSVTPSHGHPKRPQISRAGSLPSFTRPVDAPQPGHSSCTWRIPSVSTSLILHHMGGRVLKVWYTQPLYGVSFAPGVFLSIRLPYSLGQSYVTVSHSP